MPDWKLRPGRPSMGAIIRSYPRDRARAKEAGITSWRLFARIWLRSWLIGVRATDPSEAKMQAHAWVERHPELRKDQG